MQITIDLDCTKEGIEDMINACNELIRGNLVIGTKALMIDVKTVLYAIEKELSE
jgi:hypothetical protein